MPDKIGIINEVGDLGLGWDPTTKKEQESIQEEYDSHIREKQERSSEYKWELKTNDLGSNDSKLKE